MDKGTSKGSEPTPPQATEPRGSRTSSGKTSDARTASKRQFNKAHRKTNAQHAGLFRRLAK